MYERKREGTRSEYDISHCAERVGLVSLRLHTKSRIVPERCSEPVFSPIRIDGPGRKGWKRGKRGRCGATSRVNEVSPDDDFDLRESGPCEYN